MTFKSFWHCFIKYLFIQNGIRPILCLKACLDIGKVDTVFCRTKYQHGKIYNNQEVLADKRVVCCWNY